MVRQGPFFRKVRSREMGIGGLKGFLNYASRVRTRRKRVPAFSKVLGRSILAPEEIIGDLLKPFGFFPEGLE